MADFGHETVAGLLALLGRKEEWVDDAIRESLKELLKLRVDLARTLNQYAELEQAALRCGLTVAQLDEARTQLVKREVSE